MFSRRIMIANRGTSAWLLLHSLPGVFLALRMTMKPLPRVVRAIIGLSLMLSYTERMPRCEHEGALPRWGARLSRRHPSLPHRNSVQQWLEYKPFAGRPGLKTESVASRQT
jgi:hypothetical protein